MPPPMGNAGIRRAGAGVDRTINTEWRVAEGNHVGVECRAVGEYELRRGVAPATSRVAASGHDQKTDIFVRKDLSTPSRRLKYRGEMPDLTPSFIGLLSVIAGWLTTNYFTLFRD